MAKLGMRNRAILLMVLCSALWSIAGIFIKLIDWHPLVIAGFRSIIAAGVLGAYLRMARIPVRINRTSLLAGVSLSATCLCFVVANKLTTSANAIVLQFTAPVFIMLISALFLHQRFARTDVVVAGLTVLGIALCFVDQMDAGRMTGNVLAVLAGLCMACMFLITGSAGREERMSGILVGHLLTSLVGIPFAFVFHTPVTANAVTSLVILGIFQLGIPYVLYGIAAEHCPPLFCCLISAIEPLLNPVWVFLFNGEAPGVLALAGGAVVIVTITAWSIWSGKQEEQAPAAELDPVEAHPPAAGG